MDLVPDLVSLAIGGGFFFALIGLIRLCRYLEARP